MFIFETAPTNFVELIRAIALAYHFNWDAPRTYLRLSRDFHNLTIEKLQQDIIKVASYNIKDYEIIPNPEIVFLIEVMENEQGIQEYWTPLRIAQEFEYREVAWINKDGLIIDVDSEGTEEVSRLLLDWGSAIEQQQWLINTKPAFGVTATSRYFLNVWHYSPRGCFL
ncbi:hypothetical protein [Gloeothece verrucosa]|uniref:Uncharacterized protein n=1 Tax=Gloeothece verrucosa (strain PCC 7822) TaxID=497965 RepID=E0UL69_GLOV7|nr:hypothetical protein [Gloeothece verrucosa]ADN17699.1 hypothetical protein Cyan7822_5845 [Gloeothece verrucosa PCC 7822]